MQDIWAIKLQEVNKNFYIRINFYISPLMINYQMIKNHFSRKMPNPNNFLLYQYCKFIFFVLRFFCTHKHNEILVN